MHALTMNRSFDRRPSGCLLRLWLRAIALVLVLALVAPLRAQAPGLVAAYGFNETSGTSTSDASGSNNTGALGTGVTRTTSGRFGGALVFNGSTGRVNIANSASITL